MDPIHIYIIISSVFVFIAFALVIWHIIFTIKHLRDLKGNMLYNDKDIYKRLRAHSSAIVSMQGDLGQVSTNVNQIKDLAIPNMTKDLQVVSARALENSSNMTLLNSRFTGLNASYSNLSSNVARGFSNVDQRFGVAGWLFTTAFDGLNTLDSNYTALDSKYATLSNAFHTDSNASHASFITMSNLVRDLTANTANLDGRITGVQNSVSTLGTQFTTLTSSLRSSNVI
jgi:hypothetical protein